MQSLRFPWSLTHIAKLPQSDIGRVAEEFLAAKVHSQAGSAANDASDRKDRRQQTLATYRLVIRLLTEMQLSSVVALSRLVDQDYLGGNVFVALLVEAERIRNNALESPTHPMDRPISIRAMARSFHRPYETMRRAMYRLFELGLVDLREDGVVLQSGVTERPEVRDYLVEMHDIMVTLLEDLFVFARLPRPEPVWTGDYRLDGAAQTHRQRRIMLAALDLHLLAVEGMQGIFSDWTGLLLVAAITAGNIREVTYHPELAFTYASADCIPPMHLRRPVLFKTLCETLPLCPTTAWRRIAVMKMLRSVKNIDDGLIVDGKWLGHPTLIANACDRIERMHGVINRMVQSGVHLNNIENLYIRKRTDPIHL